MKQKDYFDKVVNQIVEETIVTGGEIVAPFTNSASAFSFPYLLSSSLLFDLFEEYCIGIYGLTKNEIDYVWEQYKDLIKDNIIDSRI